MDKKILAIQDLSCVGQCSLTVVLPILSHYGIETAILPTAVLSNHTMFNGWSYLDLTAEIDNIYDYWNRNNFSFNAFLLGYLGKKEIVDLCIKAFEKFSANGAKKIIDPVFGDNGKLYGGFDGEYVKEIARFIKYADVIIPNVTEASFLTGKEYKQEYDLSYIESLIDGLKELTDGIIIITGVQKDGKIGEAIYSDGEIKYVFAEKLPVCYHGTGDVFAAVFTAHYLSGKSLEDSCALAGEFVAKCIRATPPEHFYGVKFESVLKDETL